MAVAGTKMIRSRRVMEVVLEIAAVHMGGAGVVVHIVQLGMDVKASLGFVIK